MSHKGAEHNLRHLASALVRRIAALPRGDLAQLRRFDAVDPNAPAPLAFYRLAAEMLPKDWDRTRQEQRLWRCLLAGMAVLPEERGDLRLGAALAEAGISESRVERLLQAPERSEILCALWLRIVRHLAAKGVAFCWGDAAMLLFASGEKAEKARKDVAMSYYYAQNEIQQRAA